MTSKRPTAMIHYIPAVFMDKNGKYLSKGTKVNFNVNNVNYPSQIADDNGAAILNVNFEPGTYTVKANKPCNWRIIYK